ncbi:DUF4124 domain-containing protein [Ramlibacter terrae]|uniref:DUF4124 domain-containing protein n=1 Tax=Ramlibacter terrae TaxID=2732511 RepID=A0ABX6P449_9BURK|nr:DUF4124 domain-containing protein [Ramlibacter terrae]
MKALRLTLLALACSAPLLAAAQSWVWVDETGRKVFSDTAPPPSVTANRIIRQPGQRRSVNEAQAQSTPVAAATAAAPAASAASAPRLTGKDAALEEKKKQAQAAEAEKKKADEAGVAQLKEENCKRARAGKNDLSSGMRVARTNAKGEPVVMDDAAKKAEIKVLDEVIARDCKPA